MTIVVGTAGHIDHGKTTLLRALTGIDADRLPEERRRGMTIDVGYAHLRLDDGSEIDLVDVPGHDRLVGNMLVGAGEIDAALVVVAADDGPRAQTLEHLELLDALGIESGIVAVTKIDTVDASRARIVADEVRQLLARTSLAAAPVVLLSAVTGAGIEQLREGLVELRDRFDRTVPSPRGSASIAIDRVFSVKGRGAVVTGTLRGGPIERGMSLRLVPGSGSARVREVQVHGLTLERSTGGRTALNLGGLDAADLRRGMVLTAGDRPAASDRILVALRPSAGLVDSSTPLPPDRARVRIHVGTDQVEASVGRSGRDGPSLPDGESAAILRLERPAALAPGDRFVLRRPSPAGTLAGGRVLDVEPPRGVSRRRSSPERLARLATAVAEDPRGPEAHRSRLELHGAIGGHVPELADDVARDLEDAIVAFSAAGRVALSAVRTQSAALLRRAVTLTATDAARAVNGTVGRLVDSGRLERVGDQIAPPGSSAERGTDARTLAAMDRLETILDVAAPPPLDRAARDAGCPPDAVRELERQARIVRLSDEIAYAAPAYRRLEATALELAAIAPLTPAAFRDAIGASRKYVMAILEDLDRREVLRRTPAGHVPGRRALTAAARL
jgi:selenocysteine-specific elongation factor